MNDCASSLSCTQRSTLLTFVLGAHLTLCLLMMSSRPAPPTWSPDKPLFVDLLQETDQPSAPEEKHAPIANSAPKTTSPVAVTQTQPMPIESHRARTPMDTASPSTSTPENNSHPNASSASAETPSPARFDAVELRNPAPPYPPLARRMGEEGKVILRVQVSPEGSAEHIEIRTSSGSQRLDDSAVNTVKRWKFIAARRGETFITSSVLVPIIFKLEQ